MPGTVVFGLRAMRAGIVVVAACLLLAGLAGSPAVAAVVEDLVLHSAAGPVSLDEHRSAELGERMAAYLERCHHFDEVVRDAALQQDALRRRWEAEAKRAHVRLRVRAGEAGPRRLQGKTFEALVGFSHPQLPEPTLARHPDGTVESLIKCPGLESLLLTCKVHELLPDVEPGAECDRWQRLAAGEEDAAPP